MAKILKFRAKTMPMALEMVKKKLGSSAIILHSRPVKQGGFMGIGCKTMFEITAKLDEGQAVVRKKTQTALKNAYGIVDGDKKALTEAIATISSANRSLSNAGSASGNRGVADNRIDRRVETIKLNGASVLPDPLISARLNLVSNQSVQDNSAANDIRNELSELKNIINDLVKEQRRNQAPDMPDKLYDTYLELVQKEVADEIAREMIHDIQNDLTGGQAQSIDVVRHKLIGAMESMVKTCGPIVENLDGTGRVVMMVGPTGVGKTTTIAKVAADMKLRRNKNVGLITIDTYRIGAVDQLRMYAQIIDVPLKVVLSPAELKEAIEEMRQTRDVVLIDTAGRSHTDEIKLKELKTYINSARPDEIHLVLSGTSSQNSIMSAAQEFGKLGVDRVILTKLDESISFGVIFSVLRKLDASLSYVTTGQDVPDDIEVAAGRRLARLLLGEEGIKKLEIAV